mgnify:CR=1 FL=1
MTSLPVRRLALSAALLAAATGTAAPLSYNRDIRPILFDNCFSCHADKRGPFLWEHAPVRFAAPTGPELTIHRRVRWGQLADLLMLDTRQYRSNQSCSETDVGPRCEESRRPDFTVLGPAVNETERIAALKPDEVRDALRRHLDLKNLSVLKAGDFK